MPTSLPHLEMEQETLAGFRVEPLDHGNPKRDRVLHSTRSLIYLVAGLGGYVEYISETDISNELQIAGSLCHSVCQRFRKLNSRY